MARSSGTIATIPILRPSRPCWKCSGRRPRAAISRCWAKCSNWDTSPNPCTAKQGAALRKAASTRSSPCRGRPALWPKKRGARVCRHSPCTFLNVPKTPANSSANWSSQATPSCSKDRAASKSSGPWRKSWRNHAVFPALRKAIAARLGVPRLPVRHLPNRVRQPDRALSLYRPRSLADRQAAPVPDRPVYPRGRSRLAPEEGGYPHHGWCADHRVHRHPHLALGGPAQFLRVDRGPDATGLRRHRFRGRLFQSRPTPQSGTDRAPQDAVSGRSCFCSGCGADVYAHVRGLFHRHERSLSEALQTDPADLFAVGERLDLRARRAAVLHLRGCCNCRIVEWREPHRRSGWLGDRPDGGRLGRADGPDLRRRARHAGRIPADREKRAHFGADHLLRLDDGRQKMVSSEVRAFLAI